jgi:hypothetical protein
VKRVVIEGVATPISDCEVDCLEIKDKLLSITDFFPKKAPLCAISNVDSECLVDYRECQWRKSGVCKAPKYKIKIVVEYEEVGADG